MIRDARARVVAQVNSTLVDLYWRIGAHLSAKIAVGEWGDGTVEQLATHIRRMQPNATGFSAKNLWRMRQFYDTYANSPILSPLVRELSWTHNLIILSRSKREDEREFYLRVCQRERWTKRELERQLDGALFERVALSPVKLSIPMAQAHPSATDVFRDSYLVEVRHDNREGITDSVSRTLGRGCLSRSTYSPSKDVGEHSLLVKRRWATKCPNPRAARLAKKGEGYTA
ncbi:Uncharacterized protein OS=gamma proteobacterium HdN1 GN=HDN1F_36730 PE=4 SV=1: DUF1016 [Gemmata massiliana]|uniref:YhcG N-terminal domain-containing protein n=2 Tax=Gemmata massiliana TaxID=1210884 RepID=A0A6P2DHE0_9BACT|nr:Uncharacterized protein OS=gamma proteobacterium HdN1 GN=HDN1F_36730 PE=4 SV=1: DUF1016 [Gemmata massiliana]